MSSDVPSARKTRCSSVSRTIHHKSNDTATDVPEDGKISIRYDGRMHRAKSARGRKRRGRKQRGLLRSKWNSSGGKEAKERWNEIFKLLEAEKPEISKDAPDKSDGSEYDQLSLF